MRKMSKFHIKAKREIVKDGVTYSAPDIEKDVNIDFTKADYKVAFNPKEALSPEYIELIPDNMDFLHEVTDIFPLSEYEIKLTQGVYRYIGMHVSINFDIRSKETGDNVYFADSALLSDEDYEYLRDVLAKGAPQYDWQTAKEYLCSETASFLGEVASDNDLITDNALDILTGKVSERYAAFKMEGYVDFDSDDVVDIAKTILEDALKTNPEFNEDEKAGITRKLWKYILKDEAPDKTWDEITKKVGLTGTDLTYLMQLDV